MGCWRRSVGGLVAYTSVPKVKKCRIGQVRKVFRPDQTVLVHRFLPISDGRLRVAWMPAYVSTEGTEVVEPGSNPSQETVTVQQLVMIVQLSSGVLSHAAARKLDRANWRLDEQGIQHEAGVVGVPPVPSSPLAIRLEEFFGKVGTTPVKAMRFSDQSLKKWCATRYVDFLEVFCGEGMLTEVILETGLVAGEGIDGRWTSYGQVWDLRDPKARLGVAWLVAYGLQPLALHSGTPCTDHSQIGQRVMRPGTEEMVSLVTDMLLHQEKQGYLASNEQPDGSLLYSQKVWVKGFGLAEAPHSPWKYYRTDGCQLGVVTPDRDAPGQPHRKTQ